MRSRDGSVRPIYHAQIPEQSVTVLRAGPVELRTADRLVSIAAVVALACVVHAAG